MGSQSYTADLSATDDAAILVLWKMKFDTYQIATKLKRPEWQIANRLLHLRDEQSVADSKKPASASNHENTGF